MVKNVLIFTAQILIISIVAISCSNNQTLLENEKVEILSASRVISNGGAPGVKRVQVVLSAKKNDSVKYKSIEFSGINGDVEIELNDNVWIKSSFNFRNERSISGNIEEIEIQENCTLHYETMDGLQSLYIPDLILRNDTTKWY